MNFGFFSLPWRVQILSEKIYTNAEMNGDGKRQQRIRRLYELVNVQKQTQHCTLVDFGVPVAKNLGT